jgi:hypothetical protein
MISTVNFFKNSSFFYLPGKFAYSILAGVIGTILIFLFLNTFLHVFEAVRFLPWIIAFNTAITGYSLLDKTRDQLRHKHIAAMSAGIVNVIITCAVFTSLFIYLIGESLFSPWDLVLFFAIGIVCSELGALLAIKYFKLKK